MPRPARLKFLKSSRSEFGHAEDVVQRLAMAHPEIAFSLGDGERVVLRYAATLAARTIPRRRGWSASRPSWDANSPRMRCPSRRSAKAIASRAIIGLPTLNKATAAQQFLFVNGRPVRDRLLQGAVRGAYQDFLARDRHPLVALFLDVPAEEVDVNVHPAKAEVRFRDPGSGARPDRRRRAPCAGGRRTSCIDHRGRRRDGQLPSGRVTMPPSFGDSAPGAAAAAGLSHGAPYLPRGVAEAVAAIYAPFDGFRAAAGRALEEGRCRRRLEARLRQSPFRWARRGPRSTRPISSRRPPRASSSSISMRPTSGWSMSA